MTTKKITAILAVLAIALFSVSCGGGAKQAEDAEETHVTKEEAFKSVTKYPLPTAFEVTKMLNKAGASYILSLNNPVENVDKYFTEKSKALNLGIYGANLSYASTYQMKQETMNYLKVSKRLIDELQITTAFNKQFADRIEANIDNKDSLIHIISDSFYDTYDFLNQNGKDNISLLVMAGSWIEGLYITTQIAIISKNNEDFMKIIANQKDPLNKLLELMEPASTDSGVTEVKEMLKPLHEAFKKVEGEELTTEQFNEISDAVAKVRAEII
jgi:PBP1b-binding outer membrane lipoprotein LpoB